MLLLRIFIFSILLFSNLNDIPKDKTIFISPVRIPQLLSANFGELRVDHFHSGIDIKTQGVTGKEVVASADGYISRIGVSPVGFGNALYITHPSGYTTVYGHLDKFSTEIDKYVKDRQYEKKSFPITLFPTKDEFPVKQGQLIAWSGNSGSSGGPHLHFEIRKSDSEKPINPLLFDFGMSDNIKPVIEKLVIYPVNKHSIINNANEIKMVNVSGSHGNFTIQQPDDLTVSGMAGFGIKTFDLMNDSNNKYAVYSIELLLDSTSVYKYIADGFSFAESRYVNSHIDYETFMRQNTYFEKVFVLPGDKLTEYKNVKNRGLINFDDDKTHNIQIIVSDIFNNKSVLKFHISPRKQKLKPNSDLINKDITVMPYNKTNEFSSENILVNIPEGALYDTLYFSYRKEPGSAGMLSDLHCVNNIFTPVQKAFTISIKPDIIPEGKKSKMLIVRLIDEHRKSTINGTWDNGYLTADVMAFGKYYVGIDTIAPVISGNGLAKDENLSGRKELRIRVTDALSGINTYEGVIDGKWALFEYDPKSDMLIYKFEYARITKGIKHNLSLKVSDYKDNTSTFSCSFIW